MNKQKNILVLSCGTRNKIIQYFKENLKENGNVIATDCSPYAPALYETDKHYIVPPILEKNYMDVIMDLCEKEKVSGVVSLIDPELSLLAENRERLAEIGVRLVGSDYLQCEICLDKYQMYLWLKNHGYNCAKSYVDKELFYKDVEDGIVHYPVFVKPVRGSASIAVSKVYDKETIDLLFAHEDGLMIQEYLYGQEIGADCYIDLLSQKVVSVFTKKKLVMRAGETDKSVSFKNLTLFEMIVKFSEEFGFVGPIDIDIFDVEGNYYISEVNPRFGGGYPHAYECGVNHMNLIINNLCGVENNVNIGYYKEGLVMMKYNEVKMISDFK